MKLEELKLYQCYYDLSSYDSCGKYPRIDTCIYIGKNLVKDDRDDEDEWYFQDPDSFFEYGVYTSYSEDERKKINYDYFILSKEQIVNLCKVKGLIEKLTIMSSKGSI